MGRVSKPGWAPSNQKGLWRQALYWAQGGICAGCGTPFGDKPRTERSPLLQTLDHVIPRVADGPHLLNNLLLKHQVCNQRRGDAPATGCDLVWQMAVGARLAERPRVNLGGAV